MNGAAKSYRQDESQHAPRSCSEARGYSPGYHLDISHPQHSKAMNFDNHSVDSSQYFKHGDQYSKSSECHSVNNRVEEDPRHLFKVPYRVPLELPVPQFEIDENYVGEPIRTKSSGLPKVENSSELDLDTRIDFLIKSKALAGMHPIFSQLESEESSNESDDPFKGNFRSKKKKRHTLSPLPVEHVERFDDPEMPLSRPPSPFLSRATYLFWFNKAIELKKQAKAQEQALLEKAAKKLLQENSSSQSKSDQDSTGNHKIGPLPKNVLDEVCSELKEMVKNEFIREVFEDTVFSTLEHWWESNCREDSTIDKLPTSSVTKSENLCLKDIEHDLSSMSALENGDDEINRVINSPIKIHEPIQNIGFIKPILGIAENVLKNEESAKVEGQYCSNTLNANFTTKISDNISANATFYEEANENDIFNDLSVCENGYSSNLNIIPRINQPILDESSLFLPFPKSSEVPEVPHQRFEQNEQEKNEIVMNILNTILENVPRMKAE